VEPLVYPKSDRISTLSFGGSGVRLAATARRAIDIPANRVPAGLARVQQWRAGRAR
jgi:hypothetical protein